jgi:four helix bundle protein
MGSETKIRSHRDLDVWKVAIDLTDAVYVTSDRWPKEERYALTNQIRRAAVSVPSNIAEGNGRRTTKDYLRFLDMAFGSLMEVDTQVCVATRRNYITAEQESDLLTFIERIGKMLNALMSSLERKMAREAR